MKVRDVGALLKATFQQWGEHKSPRLAAALAYYTVFAIAPLLIIVIAIAGLVFGHDAAARQILGQIGTLTGHGTQSQLSSMISAASRPKTGIIASILGVITLILAASGVVLQLQDALDVIWDVEEQKSGGLWQTIRTRLLSIGMLMGLAFLLIVSLAVSAGLSAINTYTNALLPALAYLMQFVNVLFDIVILSLLFAIIYKYLPKAEVSWKDVRVGAVITAALFIIGQFLITLYLGKLNASSPYGDAGALIILLLWVYYSAQLLLFGAEFTNVWAQGYGDRIAPARSGKRRK
ncbi:MAG: YihY/virulence factor BrkB family protein [Candidatus Eremiobacteraeota bacterium]|nr:YihY/virulence factor BrkB family protein [Candidatus Eremiobacteraeota bacterium]